MTSAHTAASDTHAFLLLLSIFFAGTGPPVFIIVSIIAGHASAEQDNCTGVVIQDNVRGLPSVPKRFSCIYQDPATHAGGLRTVLSGMTH